MARLVAIVLLLVAVVAYGAQVALVAHVRAQEEAWAASTSHISPSRIQATARQLSAMGATLTRGSSAITTIALQAPQAQTVMLVNTLSALPLPWRSWSATMSPDGHTSLQIQLTGL